MEQERPMRTHTIANAADPLADQQSPRLPRLASIISRIEEAVDEETASIRTDMRFDLRASNARKSRYLYELTKAVKGADGQLLVAEERESIARLREKLALNEKAILAHLNAVAEVAALIQDAIQSTEADGTYTPGEIGRI